MSLAIVFWYVNRFWFIKKKKRLIQEGQRIIIELLCKNWDKTSVYKWKNFYSLFFMYLCHCYTDRSRDWKIIEVHCCASVLFLLYIIIIVDQSTERLKTTVKQPLQFITYYCDLRSYVTKNFIFLFLIHIHFHEINNVLSKSSAPVGVIINI